MGDNNGDEDGDGVDGDGSGGDSPSPQGTGTKTSVLRTLSATAVALRNFIWENADFFRVFASEGLYRRKGDVRGWTRGPHHLVARPEGGVPPYGVPASWPPSVSPLDSVSCREK
jgi:hypothetical protein